MEIRFYAASGHINLPKFLCHYLFLHWRILFILFLTVVQMVFVAFPLPLHLLGKQTVLLEFWGGIRGCLTVQSRDFGFKRFMSQPNGFM